MNYIAWTMPIRFICAVQIVVLTHLFAMALCACAAGIAVRKLTFGVGPRLFDVGWFRVGLLPFGGSIRMSTADAMEAGPADGVFEGRASLKRTLVPLSGPLALLGLGYVVLGAGAFDQFKAGFTAFFAGALSPLEHAQTLLGDAAVVLRQAGSTTTIGLVACKLAAFNLLPFIGSNGTQAVQGLLPPPPSGTQGLPGLLRFLTMLILLSIASWLFATIFFLSQH